MEAEDPRIPLLQQQLQQQQIVNMYGYRSRPGHLSATVEITSGRNHAAGAHRIEGDSQTSFQGVGKAAMKGENSDTSFVDASVVK